jgi:hypothetical protein
MSETADVRQVIERMRKLADERAAGVLAPCPTDAECDDCDTVRALRDGADLLESLASQPAPSGWQQRIAVIESPWDGNVDHPVCWFCSRPKWSVILHGHCENCLWQNAVDTLPPAPEGKANRFDCPTCGQGIAVDDEACCRSCGADATPIVGGTPVWIPEPDAKDAR